MKYIREGERVPDSMLWAREDRRGTWFVGGRIPLPVQDWRYDPQYDRYVYGLLELRWRFLWPSNHYLPRLLTYISVSRDVRSVSVY